ncbi:MAG: hypothetical protein KBC84_08800, partial [Proteobacteria bacterium]|nr:hypothetical protein [Pseudomonadota bacterium]
TSNHGTLYTSEKQEIYKAIISTVWHPDNGSGNGMSSYIKSLIANSKFLQNIIVFGPDDSEKIKLISKTVSSFQLKSYIVPVPSSFNNLAFNQSKDSKLFDFLTKKFLKSKNVLPSQSYYSTANSDYEIIQPQRRF